MVLNILEGLAIYSTRHVSANTNIESYHHLDIHANKVPSAWTENRDAPCRSRAPYYSSISCCYLSAWKRQPHSQVEMTTKTNGISDFNKASTHKPCRYTYQSENTRSF